MGRHINVGKESGIRYQTDRPKHELFDMLGRHLTGALNQAYDVAGEKDSDVREPLQGLSKIKGQTLQWMPEVALLTVTDDPDGAGREDRLYTLLHDNGFSNIASLFNTESRRLPDEDGITVARGLIGAYPNAFYRVKRQDLLEFIAMVASLGGEEDYRKLAERFALRRTNREFWHHSDVIHETYRRTDPVDAGSLDYNRLENR